MTEVLKSKASNVKKANSRQRSLQKGGSRSSGSSSTSKSLTKKKKAFYPSSTKKSTTSHLKPKNIPKLDQNKKTANSSVPPFSTASTAVSSISQPQSSLSKNSTQSKLNLRNDDHYSPTAHMKAMMADLGHIPPETVSIASVFSHPPPKCPKEAERRRTHARAKKLFRRDVFGADEEEFRATKLHHHLNAYLPSDVQLVPVDKQSVRTLRARNRNGCCTPSVANCGTCCCLKIFIVATLLIAALMFLIDPCYPLKEFFFGPDIDTEPKVLPFSSAKRSFAEMPEISTNYSEVISSHFTEKLLRNNSREFFFGNKKTNLKKDQNKMRKDELLHCPYKTFYIGLLSTGVLIYLSICSWYSLQLATVHCHRFPWFLLEAGLLLLYSFLLVGASVGAFLFKGEVEATVLGLIDGLLGLFVGLWNYGNWRAGLTPLENIVADDPDQNLVARVIGSRQISKLFAFSRTGKEDTSDGGREVGSVCGKQLEQVMVVIVDE